MYVLEWLEMVYNLAKSMFHVPNLSLLLALDIIQAIGSSNLPLWWIKLEQIKYSCICVLPNALFNRLVDCNMQHLLVFSLVQVVSQFHLFCHLALLSFSMIPFWEKHERDWMPQDRKGSSTAFVSFAFFGVKKKHFIISLHIVHQNWRAKRGFGHPVIKQNVE